MTVLRFARFMLGIDPPPGTEDPFDRAYRSATDENALVDLKRRIRATRDLCDIAAERTALSRRRLQKAVADVTKSMRET
jgi:hypothetical protein